MKRKAYPSDLTDEQWAALEELIPPAKPGGRPREHPMREVLNALFYHAREGCSWRALAHDFGVPWKTAYNYFRAWAADGTWEQILTALRMRARRAAGRDPDPRFGHIDCAKKAWEGRMRCRKQIRNLSAEPCGWKARPVAPDQRPEASLAWRGVTRTAKRRQRVRKPCS